MEQWLSTQGHLGSDSINYDRGLSGAFIKYGEQG